MAAITKPRPVEYLKLEIRSLERKDKTSREIAEHIYSDEFVAAFKTAYPYRDLKEELSKYFYELKHYGRVLEDTPFRCVYGEDGSLQYYHMCQKCGNILHDPHDEWYVTEHDMMCPTCNSIDTEKYLYATIPRGSMKWVHLVRSAEFTDKYNEENPEHAGYVAGSARNLAFRVTCWMAFKWWVFVRWSRIKSVAHNILHPVKYIRIIKKRNEWRREMLQK